MNKYIIITALAFLISGCSKETQSLREQLDVSKNVISTLRMQMATSKREISTLRMQLATFKEENSTLKREIIDQERDLFSASEKKIKGHENGIYEQVFPR